MSKKRPREEVLGSDGEDPTGPGNTVSVVPVKKALDINALKAKLAAAKQKVAEMKATVMQTSVTEDKPREPLPSTELHLGGVQKTAATSSANARYQQELLEKRLREQRKQEKDTAKSEVKEPELAFDPRIKRAAYDRKARPLMFLEEGALTKKAEAENEKIVKLLEAKKPATAPSVEAPQARRDKPSPNQQPQIEWWDLPYYSTSANQTLESESSTAMDIDATSQPSSSASAPASSSSSAISSEDFNTSHLREDLITLLIHHPILTKPAAEAPPPPPRPLMLTPAQEKRLAKTKRRMERDARMEEILLGIRPPEKGRVRIANMMKTEKDAITDPTLAEKRMKQELMERESRHHARNQERKLSPEERKEKERAKLREDTSLCSRVAVFRILSLANGKNRFKIDIEAKKNNLSGVAVYSPDFVVLAVEGGPQSIARFAKKMLKSVPWKQPPPPTTTTTPSNTTTPAPTPGSDAAEGNGTHASPSRIYGKQIDPEDNECHLVWEGEVLRRAFTDFRFTLPAKGARAYFDSLGVVHYYDSAHSYVPPDVVE